MALKGSLPGHARGAGRIFTVHRFHPDDPPSRPSAGSYRAGVALDGDGDIDGIANFPVHCDCELTIVGKPDALAIDLPGSVATRRAGPQTEKTRVPGPKGTEDSLEGVQNLILGIHIGCSKLLVRLKDA